MIDIEYELFDKLSKLIEKEFPQVTVGTDDIENVKASFPYVSIEQTNVIIPRRYRDSGDKPKFARVTYKIEVYSNKHPGKKTECKQITSYIDDLMYGLNFTLDARYTDDNIADRRLYRMFSTYSAETDGTNIYRR